MRIATAGLVLATALSIFGAAVATAALPPSFPPPPLPAVPPGEDDLPPPAPTPDPDTQIPPPPPHPTPPTQIPDRCTNQPNLVLCSEGLSATGFGFSDATVIFAASLPGYAASAPSALLTSTTEYVLKVGDWSEFGVVPYGVDGGRVWGGWSVQAAGWSYARGEEVVLAVLAEAAGAVSDATIACNGLLGAPDDPEPCGSPASGPAGGNDRTAEAVILVGLTTRDVILRGEILVQ